jgi:flagellar motor switch protein FliG
MKYFESKRVQNINFIMNDIHNSSNQIYEHLIDEEFPELKQEVNKLIKNLKLVLESVQNDI